MFLHLVQEKIFSFVGIGANKWFPWCCIIIMLACSNACKPWFKLINISNVFLFSITWISAWHQFILHNPYYSSQYDIIYNIYGLFIKTKNDSFFESVEPLLRTSRHVIIINLFIKVIIVTIINSCDLCMHSCWVFVVICDNQGCQVSQKPPDLKLEPIIQASEDICYKATSYYFFMLETL